ncbi:MAG: AAA family ATPase [Pseudomonadota bacterium]
MLKITTPLNLQSARQYILNVLLTEFIGISFITEIKNVNSIQIYYENKTLTMLKKIQLTNFISFGKTEVDLESINILIGGNGSGKSNFISLFTMLNYIHIGRLRNWVINKGGFDNIIYNGIQENESINLRFLFDAQFQNIYELSLRATEEDYIVDAEKFGFWKYQENSNPFFQQQETNQKETKLKYLADRKSEIPYYIYSTIKGWKVFHFDDVSANSNKKRLQNIEYGYPLHQEGDNIVAFLYYLKQNYIDYYDQIVETIRLVTPYFDDFILEPEPTNPNQIKLKWREKNNLKQFNAALISDGTIRFICLCALLLQPTPPKMIVIDEPELGLHPLAISLLAELIKKASLRTQIIFSTQSVTLLNQFEPQDILVVDRTPSGSQINRLNQQELQEWLDEYSLGQLWENNYLGGRY